ncbi:MBL fold metallo-hydrolase [Rhabdothermincola salaria]|uniref:MBL fold metallo-hydrolase n=1 Tax=Rhabdothermincola salaria TaxID=2903142 RepID=UPI001E33B555|nr:MBL fold metallo-hydrolase [Rhabdothermincola salaria]
MGLTLTVLGCSGSYPAPDVPCSGYLVRSDTTAVVLDMGHGAFAELQRHIDVADVDAVVLTHAHPDHWVDLTGMRILTHYGRGLDHVPVWGTDETRRMVATVSSGIEPAFRWHVLGPERTFAIGDLELRIERTDHYVETYAVRVTGPDGTSLLYSSDTGPGWSPAELGHDVDLALVESSYLDADELGDVLHLCADMAGAAARAAGARRLVLTHLVPGADPEAHARAAAAAYGGPVDVASPGAVYAL